MSGSNRVRLAARAADVVAGAGLLGLVTAALSVTVGQPFGTLNDAALLIMTLAVAPIMLGFYELGGRTPISPARLSLSAGIAAVSIWSIVQLALIVGLVSSYYLHEAAFAIQSVAIVIIGAWLAGANLLAGPWLRPVLRGVGVLSGIGFLGVGAGSLLGGVDHPLTYLGGVGYQLILPIWAALLGRSLSTEGLASGRGAQEVVVMTVKSGRGIVVGAFIALVVPISYWVVAVLLENGIALVVPTSSTSETLTGIALSEVFLGPIGILIVGWSAGIRGAIAWLALIIIAVPVLAFVWFLCVATLSGALGSPF